LEEEEEEEIGDNVVLLIPIIHLRLKRQINKYQMWYLKIPENKREISLI